LKWSDIDIEKKRIKIYSPKKKEERYVPLFPEIAETLTELEDELRRDVPDAPLEDRIFPDWTDKKSLGGFWDKTAKRAGIILWARPADNMRSTRENELKHVCTVDVLMNIMGHSAKTSLKHYLRVSEKEYSRLADLVTGKLTREPAGIEGICVESAKIENSESGRNSFTCNDLQHKSLCDKDLYLTPTGIEPVPRP